jgi:hypothetical protein
MVMCEGAQIDLLVLALGATIWHVDGRKPPAGPVDAILEGNYLPRKGMLNLRALDCSGYTEMALPAEAFRDCLNLNRITLGDKVTKIGDKCFAGCLSLEIVEAGPNCRIQEVGEDAFSNCVNLKALPLLRFLEIVGSWCLDGAGVTLVDFAACEQLREHGFDRSEDATRLMLVESIVLPAHLNQDVVIVAPYLRYVRSAAKVVLASPAAIAVFSFAGFRCVCEDRVTTGAMADTCAFSERAALCGRVTRPFTPDGAEW